MGVLNDKARKATKLVARTARSKLKNVSRKPTPVPVDDVIAALGGRPLGVSVGNATAPVALLAIRDALMDRLRSTGGRPALSGDGSRQRVQISANDWQAITDIAGRIAVGHHKPSPAQVASVLIHLALERIAFGEIGQSMQADPKD